MTEYGNIPVSVEYREKLRIAKAKEGCTYEELLKENMETPIEELIQE